MRGVIEYVPDIFIKVDGKCVGYFIKSQLRSSRVPGNGPGLPPNTIEVTDREQEGLELDSGTGDGWVEYAYDPETDKFTKYDPMKVFPENADGEGGNP